MNELMWFAIGTLNTLGLVILLPRVYRAGQRLTDKRWEKRHPERMEETAEEKAESERTGRQWEPDFGMEQTAEYSERLLIRELLRRILPPPRDRVRTYPAPEVSPEPSWTPYLAGAGGRNPSGLKPQRSRFVSPDGRQEPLAEESTSVFSKSGELDQGGVVGSSTLESTNPEPSTLSQTPPSPGGSTSETVIFGNGRAARDLGGGA